MKVELRIGRLTVDMPHGSHLDPSTVKSAIERELAAQIKAGRAPSVTSGANKSITTEPPSGPSGLRRDSHVTKNIAARIFQEIKR